MNVSINPNLALLSYFKTVLLYIVLLPNIYMFKTIYVNHWGLNDVYDMMDMVINILRHDDVSRQRKYFI